MSCLDLDDYQLIRHHVELTAELDMRRAARPDLIETLTKRVQRDIERERAA